MEARAPSRHDSSSAAFTTSVGAPGDPAARISLRARAPSSPPILAIAVTASSCGTLCSDDDTARTLSSSKGIARVSLSNPSANAAAAWTAGTESLSTGSRRSTPAASPIRPAASAPWRRTAGFAWLNASRSAGRSKRRASAAASNPASTPTVVSSAAAPGCWAGAGRAASSAATRRRLETDRVCRGFEELTHVLRKARERLLFVQRDERRFGGGEQLVGLRPLHRVSENHPSRGQVPHPAADANHIIIARRLAVADVNIRDGEVRPLLFQVLVGHATLTEVFRARHIHPDEIVRVVDEAHLIGFGVVHAVKHRIDYGGCWLGLGELLAVRNPDVLYFRRAAEELASLTLTCIEPVARARRRPRALHVRGRRELDRLHARGIAEVPHPVHIVVLGEHLCERILRAGDHVDDAVRDVGGLEHCIELSRGDGLRLGRDDDDGVAERD